MKYWVDTDAGVDDALALAWAFLRGMDIAGISTVSGNLPVASTVNNIKALAEHYGLPQLPVYRGAAASFLGKTINAAHVHGIDLGPIVVDREYPADGHVMEALPAFFRGSSENLTIITLGPLTNLASFLIHYPEYKSRIDRLIIMGGGTVGNIAPYAEFNIYADPESAQMVLSSGLPIVLSDIDITDTYAYLNPEDFRGFHSPLEDWAARLLEFRIAKSHHPPAARIYDVLPFMFALYPDLFTWDKVAVEVQLEGRMRGHTAYDYINNRENNFLFPETNVPRITRLRTIDRHSYRELFLSAFINKI